MRDIRIAETDRNKDSYWKESTVPFSLRDGENNMVNIYPGHEGKKLHGFGGAFTEAAAHVYRGMSAGKKEEMISSMFGRDGLAFNMGRIHMNSCDFALGNYVYVESGDKELGTFNIEHDEKEIIPMIKDAMSTAEEDIEFIMSTWSPPAFMKTNGDMNHGGKLKAEYRDIWAAYYARFISEYAARGITIRYLNVQNEPAATQEWDSCLYSAEEEAVFVRDHLYPALREASLADKVKIFVWDHNKDAAYIRFRDSLAVPGAEDLISGCSLHWYTGDHFETVKLVCDSYPDKEVFFTEGCIEYSLYGDSSDLSRAERYAHDMIGNLNSGCTAVFDWNLALDTTGGPNHVGNYCAAPIMCDVEKDVFEKQLLYYYIGHFSRYIRRGAVRIPSSRYTDRIESAAFINPDGERVVVLLNKCDEDVPVVLREEKEGAGMLIPAHSVRTCRYH